MIDNYIKYIDCFLPYKRCNLNCSYCYVEGKNNKDVELVHLKYSVEQMAKALSKERIGGKAIINLCSDGETLLHKNVLDFTKELLKQGHCVSIVSNGTMSDRIDKFLELDEEYLSRLFFKFSFHYLELKNKNLLDVFANNIKKVDNSPASFTIEMGASDEYIPYIDEICKFSLEHFKALPHLTILRDNDNNEVIMTSLSNDEYEKTWSVFDSGLFDIRLKYWNVKSNTGYCYAGYFTNTLDLQEGILRQCHLKNPPFEKNIFDNYNEEFPIVPIGTKCPAVHCTLCHAFLAFGDKPALKTPTYESVRNRICTDGSEWLKPTIKNIFKLKFYETNENYKNVRKMYPNGYECERENIFDKLFSIKTRYVNNSNRRIITILGVKIKLKIKDN